MVKIQSWVLKNVRNLVRNHGCPAEVDGIPPRRPYPSQPPPNWNIVNLVIWDGFGAGLGTISPQPPYFALSYLGRQMESDKKPGTWEQQNHLNFRLKPVALQSEQKQKSYRKRPAFFSLISIYTPSISKTFCTVVPSFEGESTKIEVAKIRIWSVFGL